MECVTMPPVLGVNLSQWFVLYRVGTDSLMIDVRELEYLGLEQSSPVTTDAAAQ